MGKRRQEEGGKKRSTASDAAEPKSPGTEVIAGDHPAGGAQPGESGLPRRADMHPSNHRPRSAQGAGTKRKGGGDER